MKKQLGKHASLLELEARTNRMIATLNRLFMGGVGGNGGPSLEPLERVREARVKLRAAVWFEDELKRVMKDWPAREEFLKPKLVALVGTIERVEGRIESFKRINGILESEGEESITHDDVSKPPAR